MLATKNVQNWQTIFSTKFSNARLFAMAFWDGRWHWHPHDALATIAFDLGGNDNPNVCFELSVGLIAARPVCFHFKVSLVLFGIG